MAVTKIPHPKREFKRISVQLPLDQIELINDCAKAIGLDRSTFIQVFLDVYAENMQSFVVGWLTGMKHWQEKVEEKKRVEEAKKISEALGTKVTEVRSHESKSQL